MKITTNAVWLVGCRVSADVLSLVLFITISRYFGPSGVGAYSYGFAIATFVYVIGSLGLDEYGVREYARLPADRRPALMADLLGTQAMMLSGAVVGLITYLFVTDASRVTMGIVGSLAAYQLAYALTRTLFVPAIANQAMVGPAVAELGCRGGAIAVAVLALVVANSSLLVALSGFSVFALLLIIAGIGSAYQHGGTLALSTSRRAVAGTVKILWSFAAAEVMVQVFTRIGLVTLSLSFGEEAAGVYATGLKFVEIACIPLIFLCIAAYPRLSQLAVFDPPGFIRVATNLWQVTLLTSGVVLWALYFLVPVLLVPLLGDRFTAAAPVLRQMTVLALMQVIEVILVRLLLAADLQMARFRIITGGAILSVILNIWLVLQLQVGGAIIAGTIAMAVTDVFYALALCARVERALLLQSFGALAASLALALVATAVARSYAQPEWLAGLAFVTTFLLMNIPVVVLQQRRVRSSASQGDSAYAAVGQRKV